MSRATIVERQVVDEPGGRARHLTYRPHLDGLRTVAVYLVVAFHSGLGRFSGGFIGVDIFFVLSGFLVTRILVRDLGTSGRVRWRQFYARRVRRILPAALITLLVTALVFAAVASPLEKLDAFGGFRAAFFYVANWFFIHQATNYFAVNVNTNPVLHFWSLAVEEQFYLLWPLLLSGLYLAVSRVGRYRWWVLRAVVVGAGIASAVAALRIGTSHLERAYYGTDTRAYQLLAGAALALTPQLLRLGSRVRPVARRLAAVALVALVLLGSSLFGFSPITRGIATVAFTSILIVALENARGGWAKRTLSSRRFTYLGRVSYGTYLWHWPIIVLVTRGRHPAPLELFVIVCAGATTLAAISFRLLEHPIRTARTLDRFKTPVIAIGFTTSILVGAFVIPPILDSSGGSTAVALPASSKSKFHLLDWRAARLDVPPAPDCLSISWRKCIVVRGTKQRVVLVGDSHALMWLPAFAAIAKRESWTLVAALVTTCGWQRDLVFNFLVRHEPFCARHQADWYDRIIPEFNPDIVILAERAYDDPRQPLGFRFPDGHYRNFGKSGLEQDLIDVSLSQIRSLRDQNRKVVILEPIPDTYPFLPLKCLSEGKSASECRYRASTKPTQLERAFRQAGQGSDVWSLDLDHIVCPRLPTCDSIVGNVIVYRDDGHVTATFARSQADAIEKMIIQQRIPSSALRGDIPAG